MPIYELRLPDSTLLEFDTAMVAGVGAEKTGFFSTDGSRVVLFFREDVKHRVGRFKRTDAIVGLWKSVAGDHPQFWSAHFCWPENVVHSALDLPNEFCQSFLLAHPPFGLVVPALDPSYVFYDVTGERRLKDVRWFSGARSRARVPENEQGNLKGYVHCCAMIARSIRRLHSLDIVHGDLSNKNVMIDPGGGRACIIDLDALIIPRMPPPKSMGTPGYMAPELVAEKSEPSKATDLHALAVLIYEILLQRHPLIGSKSHADSPEECERLSMGEQALFTEHPTDKSNRIVPAPAVSYRRLGLPLQRLFENAFVNGLHHPDLRPSATEWEEALYHTQDMLHPSPEGDHWFVLGPGMPLSCPYTRMPLRERVPYATEVIAETGNDDPQSNGPWFVIHDGASLSARHLLSGSPPTQLTEKPAVRFFKRRSKWFLANHSRETFLIRSGGKLMPTQKIEITDCLEMQMSSKQNGRIWRFTFFERASKE